MDNLTHSLVGLALGELTHRLLPAEPDAPRASTRRRLLLTGAALASNFPDLDLVLTALAPAPLGYLLHHRGHTHTLLYALPQALVLLAALWLCWPAARALLRTSAPARHGLLAATAHRFIAALRHGCAERVRHPPLRAVRSALVLRRHDLHRRTRVLAGAGHAAGGAGGEPHLAPPAARPVPGAAGAVRGHGPPAMGILRWG